MKKNRYLIHQVIFLLAVAIVYSACSLVQNRENNSKIPVKTGNYFRDVFLADGDSIITRPQHLGIVNGMGSVGIAYDYVGVINGFWAPPYVSSDFFIEPRLWGERVKTDHYTWLPFQTKQIGRLNGIEIMSTTTLIYGMRAGVLSIKLINTTNEAKEIPLQFICNSPFTYRITLDREEIWGFGTPKSKTAVADTEDKKGIMRVQGDYAIAIGGDLKGLWWEEATRRFHGTIELKPGQEMSTSLVFSMERREKALQWRNDLLSNIKMHIKSSDDYYLSEVKSIFDKLPRLTSDNKNIEKLYNRSLSILMMNRYMVPELALNPYYPTGSVKGGCFKNYLWNYGAVSGILPLFDPEADKKHILQFFRSGGLYNGHSFDPISGKGTGSWYPVNQNLIIQLTYNYIKNTGDTDFLKEEVVKGETVLDHMIRNAMHLDYIAGPVKLVDYGPRGDHLELSREFTYNHVIPDLNGLRYKNYERVSELCKLAGNPQPYLMERAKELKKILKKELWDPKLRWFSYADDKGIKNVRYTIQMFYLLNSDVIDNEIENGLLSHLNDKEFLGDYGVHSMSKKDIAYDQVDIDNGGGGSCTIFPPQIARLLYNSGKTEVADKIMGRILWWGQRLPYFGDSQVANEVDYRQDTPLQADIGTISLAESILFGMLGINAGFDGFITISPANTKLAKELEVKGLKIRGKTIDISVKGDKYEVVSGGKSYKAEIGNPTVIQ
ncbi:MAG: hypothetical protein WCI31_05270 [Prolixibacteraceae bacterium]